MNKWVTNNRLMNGCSFRTSNVNEYGFMLREYINLNIFYLLKCAKRIRHKLNKLMKSSIYTISYNII